MSVPSPRPARLGVGMLAIGLGGTVAIALLAWAGARTIGMQVLHAAWAVPPMVVVHAVQLLVSAAAWRMLSGPAGRTVTLGLWLRIRWIREAVNALLPVAQLGGNLVAIRLLAQRGLTVVLAAAATTLDLTVEAFAQLVFTLAGIAALAAVSRDRGWWPWAGGGVLLMAVVVTGFILAQRAGLLRLVELFVERLGRLIPGLAAASLHGLNDALMQRQRDRRAVLRAALLHLLAWSLGVAETWLALAALDCRRGVAAALVIESLTMAARSAGFVVPGALGVQEGGLVLVAGLFAIPPETAIALSMVKRLRELAVGIPGLLAWQWTEGARLARKATPLPAWERAGERGDAGAASTPHPSPDPISRAEGAYRDP